MDEVERGWVLGLSCRQVHPDVVRVHLAIHLGHINIQENMMDDVMDFGCDWCWHDPCECTEASMVLRLAHELVSELARYDGELALGYLSAIECVVDGAVSTNMETEL